MTAQTRSSLHSGPPWAHSIDHGWQSAVESLAAHKLRSGLTLLGIVVGVAALLAVNVFGQLTQQAVARQFGPLGATLVSITPQTPSVQPTVAGGPVVISAASPGARVAIPQALDAQDLQALKSLPHVTAAAVHDNVPPVQAIANGQNVQARLVGATPEIQSVLGYTMTSGSFFTNQDEAARSNVVVVGATVARTLFAGRDAVGQSIQLNNVPFTIKGVLSPQGTNGEFDLDQIGIVPYSVLDRLRGSAGMFFLRTGNPVARRGALILVDDSRNVPQVKSGATQLIQQMHPPKPNEQPYIASDFTQAVQAAGESTNTVRLALMGVAALTLLLGAFGLFSVMTVSVAERTREIGVRMAVGARTRDVLVQVLIEAAVLGLVGGVLGAVIGILLSAFGLAIVGPLSGGFALPSPDAVLAVLTGSVALGIIFGVAPAWRAAHVDPASALRRA